MAPFATRKHRISGTPTFSRLAAVLAFLAPLLVALMSLLLPIKAAMSAEDAPHPASDAMVSRDTIATPSTASGASAVAVSDPCTELGVAARAVAAWRDAGGAAWLAKAKLDQQIDEPAVREAAQSLVDTLYSGSMRKFSPDEIALAVSESCMSAGRGRSEAK